MQPKSRRVGLFGPLVPTSGEFPARLVMPRPVTICTEVSAVFTKNTRRYRCSGYYNEYNAQIATNPWVDPKSLRYTAEIWRYIGRSSQSPQTGTYGASKACSVIQYWLWCAGKLCLIECEAMTARCEAVLAL